MSVCSGIRLLFDEFFSSTSSSCREKVVIKLKRDIIEQKTELKDHEESFNAKMRRENGRLSAISSLATATNHYYIIMHFMALIFHCALFGFTAMRARNDCFFFGFPFCVLITWNIEPLKHTHTHTHEYIETSEREREKYTTEAQRISRSQMNANTKIYIEWLNGLGSYSHSCPAQFSNWKQIVAFFVDHLPSDVMHIFRDCLFLPQKWLHDVQLRYSRSNCSVFGFSLPFIVLCICVVLLNLCKNSQKLKIFILLMPLLLPLFDYRFTSVCSLESNEFYVCESWMKRLLWSEKGERVTTNNTRTNRRQGKISSKTKLFNNGKMQQ